MAVMFLNTFMQPEYYYAVYSVVSGFCFRDDAVGFR